MDRLTHERCNGIKTGYWSTAKKEELIQRLAAYENTGLEPEQIEAMTAPCITVSISDEEARTLAKSIRPTLNTGYIVPGSGQSWVSVKDRLPEKRDIEVLVIATGKGGNIRLEEAYAFACYSGKDGWVLDDYPEIENPKIDWWMPLPEPPKEG